MVGKVCILLSDRSLYTHKKTELRLAMFSKINVTLNNHIKRVKKWSRLNKCLEYSLVIHHYGLSIGINMWKLFVICYSGLFLKDKYTNIAWNWQKRYLYKYYVNLFSDQ